MAVNVDMWKTKGINLPEDSQSILKTLPTLEEFLNTKGEDGVLPSLKVAFDYRVFDPAFKEGHLQLLVSIFPYLTKTTLWRIFITPVQGRFNNFRELILKHFLKKEFKLTKEELEYIGSNNTSRRDVVLMVLVCLSDSNLKKLIRDSPPENVLSLIPKDTAETFGLLYAYARSRANNIKV